jgi:hypothetical protein
VISHNFCEDSDHSLSFIQAHFPIVVDQTTVVVDDILTAGAKYNIPGVFGLLCNAKISDVAVFFFFFLRAISMFQRDSLISQNKKSPKTATEPKGLVQPQLSPTHQAETYTDTNQCSENFCRGSLIRLSRS